MKHILLSFLLLSFTFVNAQEEPANPPSDDAIINVEHHDVPEETEATEVAFAVIERVPVYKGCSESLGNRELKDCMSKSINKHVGKNFNTDLAGSLGLPAGKVRIIAMFKIDKNGLVDNVRIRAPHPALTKETRRVLNLIPKFTKPGFQRGKTVNVNFALPITFVVEDTTPSKPLTKKELRKLKREARKRK